MISVFFGVNRYALHHELKSLIEDYEKKYGKSGIERHRSGSIEPSNLQSLLTAATLFSQNRLVVIEALLSDKPLGEALLGVIDKIPEDTQVILIEEALDKRTSVYKSLKNSADIREFAELDEAGLVKWAVSRAKEEGAGISISDARFLVKQVGLDQLRIDNEIVKLSSYSKSINRENIELLVAKKPEDSVFKLLDQTLRAQKSEALRTLNGLEEAHEDAYQLVGMLIWQTHILSVVYFGAVSSKSDDQIAKDAKISPFVIQKTRNLIGRMDRNKLGSIVEKVASLDVELKSSSSSPWRSLERLILEI